jgi:ABC-2 type transport system ATP-binding protein
MIEVERLSKVFVDTPVVDDVSFFVPEGQVLGFLGPNGAGKSTTMRIITAFLPATSGRVAVAGLDIDRDSVALRRHIGYLPENVPLYPELRVDEYLRFRADIEGVPRSDLASSLGQVIDRCMLGDVKRQVIGTLSKGYRQRVGLACALIHRPQVLILDEPTVGLDPNQIIKVRELIAELGTDHTVILSTHILPEVEEVCERVLIIDRGSIVADGTPDDLRATSSGGGHVLVELAGAGDDAGQLLADIGSVESVETAAPGRFRLAHRSDTDPRREVFRLAVERQWELVELHQETASLEDVFVRLTTHDQTAVGAPEEV